MKAERELQNSRKNRITSQKPGDSVRGFLFVTACAIIAIVLAVGSKVLDNSEKGTVYAADINLDSLPTGFAGVITGVRDTASAEKSVKRIGTSCEQVMVGQRVKKVKEAVSDFNVSSSMENSVNQFDAMSMEMATPTMMSDNDYDTLLRIVEAEAGTEDIKGRVMVANVIMNRVKHEEFPDTIYEVVFDSSYGVPQFSPTYDGSIYRVTVTDDTREAVKQAMEGIDYSEGALFFIQKEAAEKDGVTWFEKDLKRLFKHGVHEFYTYPDETDTAAETVPEEDGVVQMVKNDIVG